MLVLNRISAAALNINVCSSGLVLFSPLGQKKKALQIYLVGFDSLPNWINYWVWRKERDFLKNGARSFTTLYFTRCSNNFTASSLAYISYFIYSPSLLVVSMT